MGERTKGRGRQEGRGLGLTREREREKIAVGQQLDDVNMLASASSSAFQVKIAGIIVSEEVGEQQGARKNQHHVEEVITNLSGDGKISNLHKEDGS